MSDRDTPAPRIAIGIITMRRPAILAETLRDLGHQTVRPERIIVCATDPADAPELPAHAVFILCEPGTSVQRNRLIDAAEGCDLLVFFDDDFIPEPGYLAATAAAFAADRAIIVTTGTVLADGATGPGITLAEGRAIVAALGPAPDATPGPAYNGYGCNMAVRLATVRATGVRFDERMPFYAWYEDIDFTRRLGAGGRICVLPAARGVHLGTKTGRGSGVRLGYAQMVNPIHIARNGGYHWGRALRSVARHLAINALRSLRPEPYVDRRGRLRGNLVGVADLLRGRVDPSRAARL